MKTKNTKTILSSIIHERVFLVVLAVFNVLILSDNHPSRNNNPWFGLIIILIVDLLLIFHSYKKNALSFDEEKAYLINSFCMKRQIQYIDIKSISFDPILIDRIWKTYRHYKLEYLYNSKVYWVYIFYTAGKDDVWKRFLNSALEKNDRIIINNQ